MKMTPLAAFVPFALSLALSLAPLDARAARSQYDLSGGMEYFSGKTEESLAPETGMLARLGAQTGERIFRWATSLVITSGSGEADFDDQGATVSDLKYKVLGGEFNIGFALYPLGGESKLVLQPFLTVAGASRLASISFEKTAPVSDEFPRSDSAMMFGYNLGVGADYAVSKDWGIKIQIERSQISGTLAGSTFALGGQRVMLGLFFR